MTGLQVSIYEPTVARGWETLVHSSCNGTFLHTRRFLSYHGTRFKDRSLLVRDDRDRLVGVFPAAEDPGKPEVVISHPGATYGGLVHTGSLRGEEALAALELITSTYASLGYSSLSYRPVPWIYHRRLSLDDSYALFRLNAQRRHCYLSATVDLDRPIPPRQDRLYRSRRAAREGVAVSCGWHHIDEFWPVLEQNLHDRYGVRPTHSLSEINHLHALFPDEIRLIVGSIDDLIVAGAILFLTPTCLHVQYLASSMRGRGASALDPVVTSAFEIARTKGCRYLDFGPSNEDGGWTLNRSLHDFKYSFGAGAVVLEEYEILLGVDQASSNHASR